VSSTTGVVTLVGPGAPNMTALPNSLSFGPTGTLFAYQTASGGFFDSVNTSTGVASTIGPFPTGHSSSGDLAFAGGTLYLSTTDPVADTLMKVDPVTGATVAIGPIGFAHVFGLVGSQGQLFGFTSAGQLLRINTTTGAGTVIGIIGPPYQGAASPPSQT